MGRLARNIRQLPEIIVDPQLRQQKLVQLGTLASQKVTSYRHDADDGIAVMEQEWDNLLILDACRYDLFEAHHDFPGTLRKVRSRGSQSREFMERNFTDHYHDTVYITGNPFTAFLDDDVFHATINLFDEQWDDELMTIRPESMVEASLKANEEFPNKRLIVHFMQPHYPFIGERGRQIDSGGITGQTRGMNTKSSDRAPSVWSRLNSGDPAVDPETVWDAYIENFELVSGYATELAETLDGKSVITSDHGNMFGERLWPIPVRRFGHPPGVRAPGLINVPWHELPFDERRSVEHDSPVERESVADDMVEERLRNLGYA
jgi:hypothetical protein